MYKDMPNPVTRHREIVSGAACFEGTRVPVEILFHWLAGGEPLSDFLENYPGVSEEKAKQVLELAAELVRFNARLLMPNADTDEEQALSELKDAAGA
jgi:uncharacterized protein (DUF433 family)